MYLSFHLFLVLPIWLKVLNVYTEWKYDVSFINYLYAKVYIQNCEAKDGTQDCVTQESIEDCWP